MFGRSFSAMPGAAGDPDLTIVRPLGDRVAGDATLPDPRTS
jgi:hypothetical protein